MIAISSSYSVFLRLLSTRWHGSQTQPVSRAKNMSGIACAQAIRRDTDRPDETNHRKVSYSFVPPTTFYANTQSGGSWI